MIDEIANVLTLSRNESSHAAAGDFNADGNLDGADVDLLVARIARSDTNLLFDLTGDGRIDTADLELWRALGGAENLPSGNPYLPGDANLDGLVDGSDFAAWNANRFYQSRRVDRRRFQRRWLDRWLRFQPLEPA